MNSHTPRISVGLPVFNGQNFLRRAIDSILGQEFADLELVISDNASTDETERICREAAARDSRVRYVRNATNVGAARNYNRVFELSRGTYFKWAAHDDELHPAMLRRCVEVLDASPDSTVLVYPLSSLIDEDGRTIEPVLDRIASSDPRPHRRLGRLLWTLNMCDPVFGVYRAKHLRRTQLIGPFVGADYVMLGELAMMGEIVELNEVLFHLRAHARRSMQANPGVRAKTAWFDPSAAQGWFVLPHWEQMVWAMLKSAWCAPLSLEERGLCCVTVVTVHYWRRFKVVGGLVKRRIRGRLTQPTA